MTHAGRCPEWGELVLRYCEDAIDAVGAPGRSLHLKIVVSVWCENYRFLVVLVGTMWLRGDRRRRAIFMHSEDFDGPRIDVVENGINKFTEILKNKISVFDLKW